MKKFFIVLCIIYFAGIYIPTYGNEIEDDYFDISSNYCVMGDYNSAIEYLDKILNMNPNNQKAADLKKGLTHIISKDKKSFIDNVSPTIKQAMEYRKAGDEKKELSSLIQATKEPNAYLAYYYLGNYYRLKNDYPKAIDAFNASTSNRSDFAPAYLSSAILLLETGKYQAALNPVDKYLTFNPDDDLALNIRSRAELSLGMINEAKVDNEHAIAINNCVDYQFDKAKIMYLEGKYKEAKELFTTLLKDIQTSKIYEYMALCDYALQDYNNALINFDKAILLSNDDEYLESRYNEVKQILEKNQNAQISE